jgi:AcrR family transcriptional regulator
MPKTAKHKKQSREKILQSAYQLFSQHGFEQVSIDQIMQDAEMTRGGFYAHFSSKEDLYKQSMITAARQSRLLQEKPEALTDQDWIMTLLNVYLSEQHIKGEAISCPLAFLTTDIAVRKAEVQKTYTEIYKRMNKKILSYTDTYSACTDEKMLAVTAMMIGGVSIGRALDDAALSRKLLDACKSVAQELLSE